MKAIICTAYGEPEVLQLHDIPKPKPKENEILVKIKSTCVNSGDVRVRGLAVKGFFKIMMRLVEGFTKPRKPILGNVFAGVVEEIGPYDTQFKVGDQVFGIKGFKFGTYAEYLSISQKAIDIPMPPSASFEEAEALVLR